MIEITNTPSFLCTWNDGEKVEVHTRQSLEKHYGDTNAFEIADCEIWYSNHDYLGRWKSLGKLLDFVTSDVEYCLSGIFTCDNMTIQRIKQENQE